MTMQDHQQRVVDEKNNLDECRLRSRVGWSDKSQQ